jgi:hypothetical protein
MLQNQWRAVGVPFHLVVDLHAVAVCVGQS